MVTTTEAHTDSRSASCCSDYENHVGEPESLQNHMDPLLMQQRRSLNSNSGLTAERQRMLHRSLQQSREPTSSPANGTKDDTLTPQISTSVKKNKKIFFLPYFIYRFSILKSFQGDHLGFFHQSSCPTLVPTPEERERSLGGTGLTHRRFVSLETTKHPNQFVLIAFLLVRSSPRRPEHTA